MQLVKETINNQEVDWEEVGLVTSVKDGVVSISGLCSAMAGELIQVNNSVEGVVRNVEDAAIKAIIFDTDDQVQDQKG